MNKECVGFVRENKAAIIDRWHQVVLAYFPGKMHNNTPLAGALLDILGEVLDSFSGSEGARSDALSKITRVLAVQDLPPSKAMSLFFDLKAILRATASGKLQQKQWDAMQTDMEHLTLEAFDSYMAHREKIYQLKVEESKRQTFMMSRRTRA